MNKPKIFICTDIGGSDPDDYQSLIHVMHYLDEIDLLGIACGYPRGKKSAGLKVVNSYAQDWMKFGFDAQHYPHPKDVKRLVFQGATKKGLGNLSPGARRLIKVALAHKDDDLIRVLSWGAHTDVANALRKAPDIAAKCTFFISGDWNRDQDLESAKYIDSLKLKDLKYIKALSSHRGFYLGTGAKSEKWGNVQFTKRVIKKAGKLGKLFFEVSENININRHGIKMGDTPSFLWALKWNGTDLGEATWGGQYQKDTSNRYIDFKSKSLGIYAGAKTVSDYRVDALRDWEGKIKLLY